MTQARWTWREALGMVVLGVFLLGLLMPAMGERSVSRRMQNQSQLRGIHQAMVMYSTDNGGYYPGLASDGSVGEIDVESRFRLLLERNFFAGDYLINPNERKTVWTAGALTSDNYSYAMLQVPDAGGRREEWRETMNADAIVISDRNTGTVANPEGVMTGLPRRGSGCAWRSYRGWAGAVVFNDNRAEIVETHVHDTVYGGVATADDHIFEAAGDDDAYMVHAGN